ncbi:PLP-dependent aminotransferase family protein [Agrobacterium rhizogenes]|uniref:aminotransferase-like domain-containing protein n=1 Tax=Rhizobium rhizogenes TaxID=359 RepID=UPI00115E4FD0|nr:PLP-dependent aminotransferase family protein [Rhizobium rhizogenes]NTG38926.1 PLP-dependent aminotransferase family protein [Rhizobium rhizogenes]NTG58050.1 PLP-dependent aminotransferase family protein [Rhizobium rhizogenes]NTI06554.1 PLP-dependent aminotransferase family protein [Rhizobium rhizogenes]NTI13359.1 PLP-dependent aminotransferase family protein [Rhizobium rhizogenes]TRB15050.1 PLP-dependent aminotransferase family protein [Rhizobium rhizogenes]
MRFSDSSQAVVMNFLNEIASEYPSAISFAAGRPLSDFFSRLGPEKLADALDQFERHNVTGRKSRGSYRNQLLQYGSAAGIINDIFASQLRIDENVPAIAERLLVTSGCQEALALCLSALCTAGSDVLLVRNPTYVGATGAAQALNISVFPLSNQVSTIAEAVVEAVDELAKSGRRAKALYLIPDFDNPTGKTISRWEREQIIKVCLEHKIVILEDNPYGMFRYEGDYITSIAGLDPDGCVVYLSTFSKTLSPTLRVGSAVIPRKLFGDEFSARELYNELVQRKSFLTLNTSQISQAIVGGILINQGGSLREWTKPMIERYRANRDSMLDALSARRDVLPPGVTWNHPQGGFFLSVNVPFHFNRDVVKQCALNSKVIVMPMAFFALNASYDKSLRLAFSSVDAEEISAGIRALSHFIAEYASIHPKSNAQAMLN